MYCALLLLSVTYLFHCGFVNYFSWLALIIFGVASLVLTRSRTGYWATIAAVAVLSSLEFLFTTNPVGWLILLALVTLNAGFMKLLVKAQQ